MTASALHWSKPADGKEFKFNLWERDMDQQSVPQEAIDYMGALLRGEVNGHFTSDFGTPLCDFLDGELLITEADVADRVLAAIKPLLINKTFSLYVDFAGDLRIEATNPDSEMPRIDVDVDKISATGHAQRCGTIVVYLQYMGISITADGQ